jgi:serine protease
MRFVRRALCVALLLVGFSAAAGAVSVDSVLVKYRPGTSDPMIAAIESSLGVSSSYVSPYNGVHVVPVAADATVAGLVSAFAAFGGVEFAQPNGVVTAAFLPNDTYFAAPENYQWNLNTIGMPSAWDVNGGGSPTTIVAVIDTGVAYEDFGRYKLAPDLAGTTFVQGWDFVNNDAHPNDDQGHGTHVTGTIAQTTNNSFGCAGIAYGVSIMPLKVLNSSGSGTEQDVADAIHYAADHGAKIVNMSLGSSSPSTVMEQAVNYAYSKGVTLVAATGNDNALGAMAVNYPGAYANVIAVGATRFDNHVTWYSNKGPQIDIVAPGGDLSVDQNGDGYGDGILQNDFNLNTKNVKDFGFWFLSGTSMATPHVAGVAALLYDQGVHDPDLIKAILQQTARDLEAPGFDCDTGWGLLNAAAALALVADFPHPGDANRDGKVDGGDLSLWQQFYDPLGLAGDNNTWDRGDWNNDNRIDGGDLALWQQYYSPESYLGLAALGGSTGIPLTGAAVPEPATAGLVALAASVSLLRRRRR